MNNLTSAQIIKYRAVLEPIQCLKNALHNFTLSHDSDSQLELAALKAALQSFETFINLSLPEYELQNKMNQAREIEQYKERRDNSAYRLLGNNHE